MRPISGRVLHAASPSRTSGPRPLKLLVLEDCAADAELIVDYLAGGGFQPDWRRVETHADFAAHLDSSLDIILADYTMPAFDVRTALAELERRALEIPVIVVSGTIGEERAVELLQEGAADCILKERLERLAPAVSRALEIRMLRRECQRADAQARLLACAIESTDEMVSVTDLRNRFTFVNRAFIEAYGYTAEELIGQPRTMLCPDDVPEELHRDILERTREGGWQGELPNRRKDGGRFWVHLNSSVIPDPDGGPVGFLWLARDITARKRAEAQRQTSEERTRFALEAGGIGIWEFDGSTGTATWTDTLERLHGLRPGGFGHSMDAFLDLVHPEDREPVQTSIAWALENRADSNVEYRVVWPDGSTHWVIGKGRFFYGEHGVVTAGVGIGIDVTERRQLEMQLRQAQKMEAVGQLAGGVAHDFNNLLTAILGYAELLGPTFEADDRRLKDLEEIRKSASRATLLTTQLLAFSRRQMMQPIVLDLNVAVADVLGMLRRLINEDIEIALDLAPELGRVKADAGQIQQVIMNLAVNARDAMPRGGTLTVGTLNADVDEEFFRRHGIQDDGCRRFVVLTITDTGIGMDHAVKTHIFEPFFTTKPKGEGTGLGLATVYGIVKQSGGSVWVYSEPGQGTAFKIYLPRTDEAMAVDSFSTPAARPVGGSETILLVEDESALRKLARTLLERHGYRVLDAANADGAIAVAEREENIIDLLLTDVVMPGRSGPELTAHLKPLRPNLSVLYMSGYADDAIVRRGMLAPGTPFVQKPFTAAILMRKVREVLDASQSR